MDLHFFSPISDLILFPFILYSEMHHRFKFAGSRYFKDEPEIIADIPFRTNSNQKIPILLLVKDSDQYPIHLVKVTFEIKNILSHTIDFNEDIKSHWWYKTINIENVEEGFHEIDVVFYYQVNGVNKKCTNHNLNINNSLPLHLNITSKPYPRIKNLIYGDLHYHTNITEDMVEFGAPIESTHSTLKALELDFVCNTDHSYDCDDKIGSWAETDPHLTKWKDSRELISRINDKDRFVNFILPSEELSLHNKDGYIIHALILNNDRFLPGQGDGAEIPFNFACEYSTENVGLALSEKALCIAAHPSCPVPLMHKFFFKRGKWEFDDLTQNHVSGMQIFNGELDEGFYLGIKQWIKLLLNGFKKYIYAGNDAHGNFNKFRQIRLPMISINEKDAQILGEHRSGIILTEKFENKIDDTIFSLKNGHCFVTNGPLLILNYIEDCGTIKLMGESTNCNKGVLKLTFKTDISLSENGEIKIIHGIVNSQESVVETINIDKEEMGLNLDIKVKRDSYYRCEYWGKSYRGKRVAMTNPIWIN